MVKSMTGFGRGEGDTSLGKIFVETCSINHRYCDVNIKLPKQLASFETRIKEMVRAEVSRGRIDISIKLDSKGEGRVQFDADIQLADNITRRFRN